MFYHIEGIVAEIAPNFTVIDCSGVGYGISITAGTASALHIGEKFKLYISESIGDNNFDLYGFLSKTEKKCFDMLVTVSGIGPKAALSILSYNTPDGLASAIINNDEKALTVAPGIGKKTALRVILELKDKMGKNFSSSSEVSMDTSAKNNAGTGDAFAALNILGYSNSEISKALSGVDLTGKTTEQIIKAALKNMDK